MKLEDIFMFDSDQISLGGKNSVLVIYDITDNKRRSKFAKFLEGYGIRVQKSSFEISLNKMKMKKFIKKIPEYISEEDSVRIYKTHHNNDIITYGNDMSVEYDDVIFM